MELRQLRYFVALAEELHFGRAAAREIQQVEVNVLVHTARPLSGQLGWLEPSVAN